MSRVLLTGGSGFIGSHVVDGLLDAGHEVRNYDLRDSPYHGAREIETVIGNLTDRATLSRALAGCDAAIHLAACADVGVVVEDPIGAEEANSRGTVAVLEACRATGVKRVVYGSTIWVYGESTDDPVTEESGLGLPKHLYTASKLAGEMYCTSYAELYGLEPTILRFGIPYGPRARPATVIPIFVRKALAGEPLTLAGDGLQTRRFVYVRDLADGVVRSLRPEAANRVYNLTGDETVTIRELAEAVQEQVGTTEIVHTPGRSGDFAGAEVSSARAAEELGWTASTRLGDGVAAYVAWLRDGEATAAAPVASDEEFSGESVVGVAVATLCALIGTAIASLAAARLGFGRDALHAVALTTLASSLLAMVLAPVRSLRARDVLVAISLVVAYTLLLVVPSARHELGLIAPHLGAVLLSAVGAAVSMSTFVAARRWRGASEEAAPEHAT
ncbi:MAG: UDP-glucose 4-epimerase [Solirubrobacterales bacterium]|jgi:UDP-glucose 4-epimerase|nr:UDP-glucose 4-epimerase [Solirubrobacterales bacterium]